MSISTIIPPKGETPPDEETRPDEGLLEDVFLCLKRQPNIPLTVDDLMESVAGATSAQVEQAIDELEGPVPAPRGHRCSYVHRARCSNKAVFIP